MNFRLLIFLFISVSLVGCGKEEMEKNNFFTLDEQNYTLDQGYWIEYGGGEAQGYDVDVILVSASLRPNNNGDELIGVGDGIYLDFNSPIETLKDGTYIFSSTRAPFTFIDAVVIVDYNPTTEEGTLIESITGGTVEVGNSSNGTTIDFTLNFGNSSIQGNYTGRLERL